MADTDNAASKMDDYITGQRKAGRSDGEILDGLMAAGWDGKDAMKHIAGGDDVPPPPPDKEAASTTAQTSGAGQPVQVENVQYGMKMKPVASRIGFLIKVQHAALWVGGGTLAFVLTALIGNAAEGGSDASLAIILGVAIIAPIAPVYIVANKKLHTELVKNEQGADDLFYKKSVRRSLWAAVSFEVIASAVMLFNLLGGVFLEDIELSGLAVLSNLVWMIVFGVLLYIFFKQHSHTRR